MSLLAALALASAVAPTQPISEDRATDLVFRAVRQLYPNEPIQCFALMTEERSRTAFDIAVREDHKQGCVGDPGVMPVRDRFRVGRSPIRLWIYDIFNDKYRPCRLSRSLRPKCVRPE